MITCRILPRVLSNIHVTTIQGGGIFYFLGWGLGGSPGSACELPRPHDDIDADDDDEEEDDPNETYQFRDKISSRNWQVLPT